MKAPDVRVVCYSGCQYAEEPREFVWEGQQFTVDRLIARGRTPSGPTFTVGCGPQQFRLSYDQATDRWTVQPIAHPEGG